MLALENEPNLVTLELKNGGTSNVTINQDADAADTTEPAAFIYGDDDDLNGKTFQL